MLALPIETPDHKHDALVIVLGPDSIERMKLADPAEVVLKRCGNTLVNPTVMICFEEDHKSLDKFIQTGNIQGLLKHLSRGFSFRPDKGDHDDGPRSIKGSN